MTAANPRPDFEIDIVPRKVADWRRDENGIPRRDDSTERTVYEIKVHDGHNGNLLLLSNQSYENRDFAVELATRLFIGKDARLNVHNHDLTLHSSNWLGHD